jgi:hypothetical protein
MRLGAGQLFQFGFFLGTAPRITALAFDEFAHSPVLRLLSTCTNDAIVDSTELNCLIRTNC